MNTSNISLYLGETPYSLFHRLDRWPINLDYYSKIWRIGKTGENTRFFSGFVAVGVPGSGSSFSLEMAESNWLSDFGILPFSVIFVQQKNIHHVQRGRKHSQSNHRKRLRNRTEQAYAKHHPRSHSDKNQFSTPNQLQ